MTSDLLTSDIELINQKVKFSCRTRENVPVTVDYTPPIGDDEGYTSLELLLISLSSCIGTSLAVTLRRMKKNLLDLSINLAVTVEKNIQPVSGVSNLTLKLIHPIL